jgi:hypothetical protein
MHEKFQKEGMKGKDYLEDLGLKGMTTYYCYGVVS